MTKEEKETFLNYIKAIAKDAKEKYQNDFNKINHAIANAIAYKTYHNDRLQNIVNDLGEKPKALSQKTENLLEGTHDNVQYKIDFPHLAAPLATSEKSVWWKEAIKFVVGFNLKGVPPKDTFFQLNSMVGDQLTIINEKDVKSNQDAYILKYHPKFKDDTLDERIEKYYHIENLDKYRVQFYNETLEIKAKKHHRTGKDYLTWLMGATFATLGAVYLMSKKIYEHISPQLKYIYSSVKTRIVNIPENINNAILKFSTKTKSAIKKSIINIPRKIKVIKKHIQNIIKRTSKKIVHSIKKVTHFISHKIVKPIYNKVIKPVGNFINKNIIKPIGNIFNKLFGKR